MRGPRVHGPGETTVPGQARVRSRRALVALVSAGLVLTACSGSDQPDTGTSTDVGRGPATDAPTTPVTDDAGPTTSAPEVSATTGPEVQDTGLAPGFDLGPLEGALREQTRWVLEQLTAEATGPGTEEVAARFSAEFLEAVPPDQVAPVLTELRDGPALTLTAVAPVQDRGEGAVGTELTLSGEEPVRLSVTVGANGLIDGLLLQPGPAPDLPEVGSWEQLDEELAALGGVTAVFVGEVSGSDCTAVHASPAATEPAPSGSVFKLLVLSAVVDAVQAGDLAWDDELTITADLKSLPSGELQDRPDGSTVAVEEAAGLMIAVSDNTATDLLMEAVGPEHLAEAVDRVTDDPDRLSPLLTTRQLFLLGWDAPEVLAQWDGADPAGREALLAQLPDDLTRLRSNPFAITDPVWPEGADWFLTGAEICTAHAVLQEQARTPAGEPVRAILSANPGVPRPDGVTYQGFKGGSVVGVLAYTFYVETADGPGRVLSVQVSHDGQILPTGYTDLTQAGLALLVRE